MTARQGEILLVGGEDGEDRTYKTLKRITMIVV